MAKNKPNSSPNLLDFEQSPPNISTRSHVTGKPIPHLHPSLTQPFFNIQNVSGLPVSPVFQFYITGNRKLKCIKCNHCPPGALFTCLYKSNWKPKVEVYQT